MYAATPHRCAQLYSLLLYLTTLFYLLYAILLTDIFTKTDNPNDDPNIRGDAFKTLIVARLDYRADEQDLEREFSRFGPIERVSFASSLTMTAYLFMFNSG